MKRFWTKRKDNVVLILFVLAIVFVAGLNAGSVSKEVDYDKIAVKEMEFDGCLYLIVASPQSVSMVHKQNCKNHKE